MYDRYGDVIEKLEAEKRKEPLSHKWAREWFAQAKITYRRIIAVTPEAVLYVGDDGRPWTAWSEVRDKGKAIVFYRQEGFAAFPSPYLRDPK